MGARGLAAANARRRWERVNIDLGYVEGGGGGARRARGEGSHRVCLGLSAVLFHLLLFDSQRVRMR